MARLMFAARLLLAAGLVALMLPFVLLLALSGG
jgi:hypothetical protein